MEANNDKHDPLLATLDAVEMAENMVKPCHLDLWFNGDDFAVIPTLVDPNKWPDDAWMPTIEMAYMQFIHLHINKKVNWK